MATTNPFASLIAGLGIKLPTSTPVANSAKGTYIGNLANSVSQSAGNSYVPNNSSGYGGMSVAPTVSTPKASPILPKVSAPPVAPMTALGTNGAPYSTTAALQASARPQANMTSAVTGRPAVGGITTTPGSSASSSAPKTARDTFVENAGATSPTAPSPTDTGFSTAGTSDVSGFGSTGTSGTSTGAGFGGNVSSPAGTSPNYRQQYLDMLSGIYSDDELKSASRHLKGLNKDMADTQLEQREQDRYIRENKAGALARGVDAQVNENNRTSASHLADLAIAANPYQSYLDSALASAKTAADYDTPQEGFTLSPGETRYDANGNVLAGGGSGNTQGDATVAAWAQGVRSGQYDISNVPAEIRGQVVQAVQNLPATANPAVQAAAQKASVVLGTPDANGNLQGGTIDEALGQINALTSGFIGKQSSTIAGTPAYNLAQALTTIKANLGFQELQAMRDASPTGGALGQVSEKEIDFLQSTIASLDQGQDAKTLKNHLEQIRTHYQNWLKTVQQANGGSGEDGGSDDDYSF